MNTTILAPANLRTPSHSLRCLASLLILFSATNAFAQPRITRQPTNLSLSIGATATFTVTATTTNGPITYQWCLQDAPLVNATNRSLILTNIQMTHAGPYTVAVTDAGGTTNSAAAILGVDPTFTKITSDPIVTGQGYDFSTGLWADYDNDGDLDLFLVTDRASYNPIYRNNGDGTFTRILEPSLQAVEAPAWVYSWGDYDNDGYPDFFVPEWRGFNNRLYHNNGNGTFTRITSSPVISEALRSSAGTWVDYDRDGDLDLFVGNGAAGGDVLSKNSFYQNQGDGTFLKLTSGLVLPLINEWGYYDLPVWVDIDNDGWQDLFLVKTGNSRNALYRNNGGRGFIKVTDDPLVMELDSHWGDAAWADYDNDGDLDVFLTTARGGQSTGPVALFRNDGLGHFTKMTTNDVGTLVTEQVNTYACCWGDYDNDGWLDLHIANGWDGADLRPDLLYHNNGDGSFTKVTTGSPVTELGAGYGGWLVDLNKDGFLDLFVAKHPAPDNSLSRLYLNNGNSNTWLCVQCVGTASPRFGTGTKVRVKATVRGKEMWQLRVIDPGDFANGQNFTAHFGLGDATNVDVLRIEWTSGIVQELKNVPVKQYLTVTEPARLSMPQPGELHIQCWKGMAYIIEGSSDLANWTPLTSLTNLNLAGGLQWSDPSAATQSARFYRAQRAEFVHPEALASTQWLEQNLGNPALRIVDARYPQSVSAFTSGHIPGAVMVDPLTDLLDPTRLPIAYVPTVEQFKALMRRLGISNGSTVVVYDTDGGLWCARLWWALRYYGHQKVKLLDGGLKKWQLESRRLEKEIVSPAPSTFLAQVHPELRATMTEVQQAMNRTDVRLVDARPQSDFIAGHIPSAKNVPAPSNLDPRTGALLEPQKLVPMYRQAGLKPGNRVITSCGGGYYGALDLFVLYQLGYESVSLYDGSWLEWTARGGTIVIGP